MRHVTAKAAKVLFLTTLTAAALALSAAAAEESVGVGAVTGSSVRLRADKNITIHNQKLKRRSQIKSEITPRANGTYTVTLAFNDDADESILKMELMVPGEVMAQDLAKRFRENAEQLYSGVLNALFEEPKA